MSVALACFHEPLRCVLEVGRILRTGTGYMTSLFSVRSYPSPAGRPYGPSLLSSEGITCHAVAFP
jgi:hypothetical protein